MIQTLAKRLLWRRIAKDLPLPQNTMERVSELIFLKKLIAHLNIDCVLDVGANRGQFADDLRKIGYAGPIVSFEPVASEFQTMQQRFKKDRAWRGYPFALGSEEETKSIIIPKLTVMSSLLEPVVGKGEHKTEMIQIRRLDGLMPSILQQFNANRIFLKMDTQGYDLEVFKGAAGCLDQIQGLQSELSVQPLYKGMPRYLQALETYEAAGFELHNLSAVVRNPRVGWLVEMNCFMRRTQ